MFKAVKACVPWLNWQSAGIAALVIVGIVVCTGLPTLSVLAGVAPVLLVIACLVPCLAPLVLLRRKRNMDTVSSPMSLSIPLTANHDHGSTRCGCGQACDSGESNTCQREHRAAEAIEA